MPHIFGTMLHITGAMPHIFGTMLDIFGIMPHIFHTMPHIFWFMTRGGLSDLSSIQRFCLKGGFLQPHFISACLLASLLLFTILLLLTWNIWSFFFFLQYYKEKAPSHLLQYD
jgi:hypothetical protein